RPPGPTLFPYTTLFRSWIKRTWREGLLNRWSVAAGLRTVSSFHAESGGVRINGSGYTVLNGQVGYQFNKTSSATLTVNNLLDKRSEEHTSELQSRENLV